MSKHRVKFSVVPVQSAPTWFTSLPYNTWVPLGNTIDSVVEDPPPYPGPYTTDDITGAGNGAGVDQVNREMLIVNTGGHSGWWGGDGYRLVLTESGAPRWERLTTWLPSYRTDIAWITQASGNPSINPLASQEHTMLQQVNDGGGASGTTNWFGPTGTPYDRFNWPTTFVDGVSVGQRVREWRPWNTPDVDSIIERPRAAHTCYSIHYSAGKMWYPTQCGSNNGSGRGSRVPQSFDVDFVRSHISVNGAPYQYQYGNKIPWKYYPAVASGMTPSTFPTSALDTGTGRIWTQSANSTGFFWLGTQGAEAGTNQVFTLPFSPNNRFANSPSAICPVVGRRMWVNVCVVESTAVPANEIVVYDLAALEAGVLPVSSCVSKVLVQGLDTLPWARLRTADEARKGYGMVWHEPSKAFLLFNCDESPRDVATNTSTIFKLHPPLNTDGTWNKAGVWSVSTATVAGIPAVCSTGAGGITGSSFSRFNIINDMGNGESLLISQGNVLNQASFMRVANFPLTGSAPTPLKWHPGHYMQILRGDADTSQTTRFNYYNQIASNSAITGVVVPFRWRQLESTRGNYAAGIALVQSEINYLKALAVPKRLFIRIMDQDYARPLTTEGMIPQYIKDAGHGYNTGSGSNWTRWRAEPMGWFIDMWKAYGAAFDAEPFLAGVVLLRESPLAGLNRPADYTSAALLTQYNRLMSEVVPAFPTTPCISPTSYVADSQTNTNAHVAHIGTIGNGAGVGGVDTCPTCNIWGDLTIRGASGGVDYRGKLPIFYSVEVSELGLGTVGPAGGFTPAQLYDYANNSQRTNFMAWDRNTFAGTTGQQWSTGILPFINATPLTNVSLPTGV